MKYIVALLFVVHCLLRVVQAQETSPANEQQLENLADQDQAATEDDSYWQQLEQFKKDPVDINTAEESELKELRIVTDLQIQNLLSYRRIFGKLIDVHELQAVPCWDLITIRRVLAFITISSAVGMKEDLATRISKGSHSLLFRVSQLLERSKGFDQSGTGTGYTGSPQKIFFRYRYAYKDLLQFGIVGDKDAGEQFLKGAQRAGFDFYSFHLFASKLGKIKALAIGDFTVNFGQGLIQWQSLAFKKSSDVMAIKRQSPVLRPYNSAGEFYFNRGAGLTIQQNNLEVTVFGSLRKLNANLDADVVNGNEVVSSLLTSGNNRTTAEIANKSSLRQLSFGGNIRYAGSFGQRKRWRWQIGANVIYYQFSLPIRKSDDPYNLYALNGDHWHNFSADYSFTVRNIHGFGEMAVDKNFHKASINGLLISVDPRVDFSILYRAIAKDYQAVGANAFTEGTSASNENGIYTGLTIRPTDAWRMDAYSDVYRFPWLKYSVDAPSSGKDFLLQLTYDPNKQTELSIRYRDETKDADRSDDSSRNTAVTSELIPMTRQNLRIQFNYKLSSSVSLRNRAESVWFGRRGRDRETGFLTFFDVVYKPLAKPYAAVFRWQYFETASYDSRLYAYENDVLYSYSIPVFYGKGWGYYLTLNADLNKKLSAWFRWSQTHYIDQDVIGSGLDEIRGNKKIEIKLQVRYAF